MMWGFFDSVAGIAKNILDPSKKKIAFDLKNEKEIEKALEAAESICHLTDKFLYRDMNLDDFSGEYEKLRKIFFKND